MTDDELDQIEIRLGVKLPAEYRRFAGDYPENLDADIRRHDLYDSAAHVIAETEMLRLQPHPEMYWRPSYVVIGDYYYLDLDESPAPVRCWDHETEQAELTALSIDDYYRQIVRNLSE